MNRNQLGAESVSFDLPGMEFEDVARWMGARLPVDDAIDGMAPCGAERLDGLHSWYWGAGEDEPMVTVRVSKGATTQVAISGGVDPVGC